MDEEGHIKLMYKLYMYTNMYLNPQATIFPTILWKQAITIIHTETEKADIQVIIKTMIFIALLS